MHKRTIILKSVQSAGCPLHNTIFDDRFTVLHTRTEEEFLRFAHTMPADVAVICLCSACYVDIDQLERLNVIAGILPVLTCSNSLNPEFIRKAALRGVERFLLCDMEPKRITELIHEAIRDNGLREFLHSCRYGSENASPYIQKFIDDIIHVFPHRMSVAEFAQRLNIDRGWLYKICKQTFLLSPASLLRRARVHQALRLMLHTNLNNRDIAVQLDYCNESSMARDLRKELGCSPREARRRLETHTPEELLSQGK